MPISPAGFPVIGAKRQPLAQDPDPGAGSFCRRAPIAAQWLLFLRERQYFLMCKKMRMAQSQPDALRVILACGLRLFWGERNPRPDRHKAGAPLQRRSGNSKGYPKHQLSRRGAHGVPQKSAPSLAPATQRLGKPSFIPTPGFPQKGQTRFSLFTDPPLFFCVFCF